jgi:UDP-2-acetamido-2,6-beta-L-arabino-hexul-4-ose reductase
MKGQTVGITGYQGFIGSHLVERLRQESIFRFFLIDDDLFQKPKDLQEKIRNCDCIVHLAGMNRGPDEEVYFTNINLAKVLVDTLEVVKASPHLIFSSSIWVDTETAFGKSKREAGRIFENWASRVKAPLSLLIIPNVFGDGGRPFYNSVVATFCYQLTRGEKPKIMDDKEIELIYINELIEEIYNILTRPPGGVKSIRILGTKKIMVSSLLSILEDFKDYILVKKIVPSLRDSFFANLYNVFLSYLDYKDMSYFPEIHRDGRGMLFEIIKLTHGGQLFFSSTRPGVIRGDHYHRRRIERFCVIKGEAVIRLRQVNDREIREYKIDAEQPCMVDIPIFHTHHIENIGCENLHTIFWSNELYNPIDNDTFHEEVLKFAKQEKQA